MPSPRLEKIVGDDERGQFVQFAVPQRTIAKGLEYSNFETITVSSTAIGLTAGKLSANPDGAFITVETSQCRYTFTDSVQPTSTIGHLLNPGDTLALDDFSQLQDIRFIRVASDATLQVSYGTKGYNDANS